MKTRSLGAPRPTQGLAAPVIPALGLAALVGCLALGGCAGLLGGGPAKETPQRVEPTAATPAVYYSGVDGLTVHGQPRSSAPVLGRLSLHDKVYRDTIERGYAHVRVEGSGLVGWVDNAKLIWRLPSAPAAVSPAPEPAPSVAPGPAPASSGERPTESTAPAPEPTPRPPGKGGASPSIFDPY